MKSSNASASSFGWDFQSNAAIMLMLKNMTSATGVKVEGELHLFISAMEKKLIFLFLLICLSCINMCLE